MPESDNASCVRTLTPATLRKTMPPDMCRPFIYILNIYAINAKRLQTGKMITDVKRGGGGDRRGNFNTIIKI